MLKCKEVVRILGSGEELSLTQRIQLKMHLWMCKHCGVYARQLRAMKDGFDKLFKEKTALDKEVVDKVELDVLNAISQKDRDT